MAKWVHDTCDYPTPQVYKAARPVRPVRPGNLRIIKGHYPDDSGFFDRSPMVTWTIIVGAHGEAYDASTGQRLVAQRWEDGDYLNRLAVDGGEFDRVGIRPQLCGSAADRDGAQS